MKTTVNAYQFVDEMTGHGFTRSGAFALFEYLEQCEEETGHELELDPIAFCCDFTEYENLQQIAHEYGQEYGDLDYLEQRTTVIEFEGGIIIFNF